MEALEKQIAKFLKVGYGNGNGYGYGSGDGNGNGSGDGSGDGNGYGSGYGSGNGSGYCYGSGYGSGNGYGNGDGSGDGVKSFNNHKVYKIDSINTLIYSVKGNIAKGATLYDDLTLKECYIAKVDNYFGHGDTAHKAYTAAESKALENEPIEERIERYVSKYPNFDVGIPAQELFEWHHILTGSCEFGRIQFATEHNIDVKTDSFTTREFVKMTENAYGGENIKLLAKRYESVI